MVDQKHVGWCPLCGPRTIEQLCDPDGECEGRCLECGKHASGHGADQALEALEEHDGPGNLVHRKMFEQVRTERDAALKDAEKRRREIGHLRDDLEEEKEVFSLVVDELVEEIDRLSNERDMAIKAIGEEARLRGLAEAECERLKKNFDMAVGTLAEESKKRVWAENCLKMFQADLNKNLDCEAREDEPRCGKCETCLRVHYEEMVYKLRKQIEKM